MSTIAFSETASRTDSPGISPLADRRSWALVLFGLFVLAAVPAVQGKLALLDLACLAALPLLFVTIIYGRRLSTLAFVSVAWALGLVLADVANEQPPNVSMQLVTAITVVTGTAALVRLSGGDPALLRLLIAAVAGGLAAQQVVLFARSAPSIAHLWKYALVVPVSIMVLALCDLRWRSGSRAPMFLALPILALADLLADARSLAALTLSSLALYVVPPNRSARLRVITVLATAAVICVLLVVSFVSAARAGWLGQRSAWQLTQNSGNVYSIMTNARPELLQSAYLISQRPITGYGSHPRLDSSTFIGSLTFLTEQGVTIDINLRKDWLSNNDPGVAAHSMMLDQIARAGILAVPFWVFVLIVGVRRAMTAIRLRASPLSAFWSLVLLWDILFSPLTGLYHIQLAAYLALVLLPLPAPKEPTQ